MKVGFTGTREGLTKDQATKLAGFLVSRQYEEFHHGCCTGADERALEIVKSGFRVIKAVAHPGPECAYTSHRARRLSDEVRPMRHFLTRNCNIVKETDVLLACPGEMSEVQRSGTWATVRYARKQKKPVIYFWPDGTMMECSNCPLHPW